MMMPSIFARDMFDDFLDSPMGLTQGSRQRKTEEQS